MPNGDPNFDPDELERYFAPIASAIEAFARRRNLLIDKYYHDAPAWFLRFRHPQEGDASISVVRDSDHQVTMFSTWHIDDNERRVRTIYWRGPRHLARDSRVISEGLAEELSALVAAPSGDWNKTEHRFPRSQRRLSRARLEAMRPRYPDPILDD